MELEMKLELELKCAPVESMPHDHIHKDRSSD